MEIHYRDATAKDAKGIFTLAQSLVTSFTLVEDDFSVNFIGLIKDSNADIIVAEEEGRLVGYVLAFHHLTFYANGVVTWVEELYVVDEYRRSNIGRTLMDMIETRSHQRGSKLVALATRRAGSFYEAIGYTESATYYMKKMIGDYLTTPTINRN